MTTDAAFLCWGANKTGDNVGQVPPAITLSPSSLAVPVNFYASVNQSFTASGGTQGTPSFSYDIYGGSLPSGLSLIGATLNGRPTQAGTFNFNLRALDGNRYMGVQALGLTVNKSDSTTTQISSANPSVYGDSATVTATVSPSPDAPVTPTGSLTFSVDGVAQAPVTLNGGTATLSLTNLPAGTRVISASYAGDSNFNASASSDLSQVIHKASTTTTVAALPSPSSYGDSVVFTATIAPEFSAPSGFGGTVTFTVDGVAQSPVAVSGEKANLSVSSFHTGPHTVSASYSGDSNFTPSASADFSQTVNKAATTIAVDSAQSPSVYGDAVTFTATVSPVNSALSGFSGTVVFTIDGADQAPVALVNGKASLDQASLTSGQHTVAAGYSGDGDFAASASAGFTQTVEKAATVTTLESSKSASVYGEGVTFTATIAPVNAALAGMGGSVVFTIDGSAQPPVALSGGKAALSLASLTGGQHTVSASYHGDGNFASSTSAEISQTVAKANTALSLTSSTKHTKVKQAVIFTVSVTSTVGVPTGTVTLAVGGHNRLTLGLDVNGRATFTITDLPAGSNAITAVYSGDGDFSSSNTALDTPVMVNAMVYLPLARR